MKERIRLIDKEDITIKGVFETFMKIERKRFGKNKFNFIKFAVFRRRGKAKDIATKILEFILEQCKTYSNNKQHVLEDYFDSIFNELHANPDFYRFSPNSWTIGIFEKFIWEEMKAEEEPYWRRNKKQYTTKSNHFEQKDNYMIEKETGWILSVGDTCELKEI